MGLKGVWYTEIKVCYTEIIIFLRKGHDLEVNYRTVNILIDRVKVRYSEIRYRKGPLYTQQI